VVAEGGAPFDRLTHTFTLRLWCGGTRRATAAGAADRFGSLAVGLSFFLNFLALIAFFAIEFYDRLEDFGGDLLAVRVTFNLSLRLVDCLLIGLGLAFSLGLSLVSWNLVKGAFTLHLRLLACGR
jgi:hypothetical protein